MKYKSRLANTIILTTFVFDFAGLSIVRIFVELHRTGHVIIDPEKKWKENVISHKTDRKICCS